MQVEGHEVAKGLHIQDKGGPAARFHGLEAGLQQSGYQPAQGAQTTATIAEEGPDQLRQRKQELPMWHRGEQVTFQPLAIGEHALLMAARAKIAGLAGIGKQVVMTALIAINARNPLMQVTAVQQIHKANFSLA